MHSFIPDISSTQLHWSSLESLATKPEQRWLNWITNPGSLTQLLISKSDNQFSVELVEEQWTSFSCVDLLGKFGPLGANHRFWSRKVILRGRGEPWVMAHTLVPEHSFMSPLREVLELNTRPLGEYLFSHPELIRTGIQLCKFNQTNWGRRSLFFLFGKPIMVAEFFLPGLLEDQ